MRKLRDSKVFSLKPKTKPYKVADGEGLYLLVNPNGSKLWRLAYRYNKKQKTLALGKYPYVSLAEARKKTVEAKKLLAQGIDPIQDKITKKIESITFGEMFDEFLTSKKEEFSKSYLQTITYRKKHLKSLIDIPINALTPPIIINCLQEIIKDTKIETAKRILILIRQTCKYAILTQRLKNDPTYNLHEIIPRTPVKHHAAVINKEQLSEILKIIWQYSFSLPVAAALKTLAYTFQRPGEVISMKWQDIDFEKKEWKFIMPKVKKEHIVPLSNQMIEIIKSLYDITGDGKFVFTVKKGKHLSNASTNAALQRMGIDTQKVLTSHGFRAVARTFLHEELEYEPDVIEHQLGHSVPDRLGATYNRTKFLNKRKKMMQDWADWLDSVRQS